MRPESDTPRSPVSIKILPSPSSSQLRNLILGSEGLGNYFRHPALEEIDETKKNIDLSVF